MAELNVLQVSPELHEAQWWEAEPNGKVHCYLCPRHCHIGRGQAGFCFIRTNHDGKLYSLGYGAPAALQPFPARSMRSGGLRKLRRLRMERAS